jgi:4-diphosphocytidyl-2-C-methyl-D-erythritol kinase
MEITAPAKVNLYLRVIRKRPDGYHDIETLFERISIFDRINIVGVPQEEAAITCSDPAVPVGDDSLMGRTVAYFLEKSGVPDRFHISLEKNIPVAAGLGGGSSDAAALLSGLNAVSGGVLAEEELFDIARRLGADVPFFLRNCSFATGRGRGDEVETADIPVKIWHVLVNPPFEVSTKDIYSRVSAFGLTNDMAVDKIISTLPGTEGLGPLTKNLHNDLQAIVLREFPSLREVFSELKALGASGTLLSGSGPTVFGVFEEEEKAAEAAGKLERIFWAADGWRIYTACTY